VTLSAVIHEAGFSRATLVCDIEGAEIELANQEGQVLAERMCWIIVELHEPISGAQAVSVFIDDMRRHGFELVWQRSWTRVFRNRRF
jgi:hypothetical protein